MRTSRDGLSVVSAGVPQRSMLPSGAFGGRLDAGYVLATYGPDEWPGANGAVTCDLVLEDGERSRHNHVPVCVPGSSGPVYAEGAWRPTPTRRNLDTNAPLVFGTGNPLGVLPGTLAALDGDRVLVGYLAGRSDRPVILGGLPHPRAELRGKAFGTPWPADTAAHPVAPNGEVRWLRHAGAVATIDGAGNVALDTTAAPQSTVGTPTGVTPAGCIALNLRTDATLTLRWNGGATALRVSPGPGGTAVVEIADGAEVSVKGNALRTWLGTLRTWLAAHVHTSGGSGNPTTTSTVPPPAVPPAGTLLTSALKLPGV